MTVSRRAAMAGILALASLPALAADPEAVAPIQALNQALLGSMRAGKATPFAQRYAALLPAVDRAFDLPAILRVSVGPRFVSMTPAEQAQLLDVFRKFTVCSYAANFDQYGGEKLDVVPGSRTVGPDQVVETNLVGSDSTRIDYVMHKSPEGWKAIDVLLNGSISQAAVNRSDWRSLLASGPGALIASLQRKVADLSGGAIR